MRMIRYLEPIEIFTDNLLIWGFRLKVSDAGQLVVTAPAGVEVSPVLRDEIVKRAGLMVEVLRNREAGD